MNQKPRTLSSHQARKFLPTLVDEAFYQKRTAIITKHDRPYAAIVPLSDDMISSTSFDKEQCDEED